MPFFQECGFQMVEQDRVCTTHGAAAGPDVTSARPVWTAQPGASPSSLYTGFIGGQVVALVGSVVLAVGPFLAWKWAIWASASGPQKTGNESLVLVFLGIIGVVCAVISLISKRRMYTWATLAVGLVGLALSIYCYTFLHEHLSVMEAHGYGVSLGTGLCLCIVSTALLIVGAVVAAASRKPQGA